MKLLIAAVSISAPLYSGLHQRARDYFDEVVVNPYGRVLTEGELRALWQGADAIIAGNEKYPASLLEEAPAELKVISKHGVGIDNIDRDAAARKGISVQNVPGANADAVADMTMGLILCALRHIALTDRMIRERQWRRFEGHVSQGKILGILGMGNIGKGVVRRAEGFGMSIMAHDPYFDEAFAAAHGVRRASVEEILREADIVSLHMPSCPENRELINARTLGMMRREAILVNTARGDLVNEKDLYEALREKRIAAAALDVYRQEPCLSSPLFTLDNIIFTPHAAGNTVETTLSMGTRALENAIAACGLARTASAPA